MGEFRPLVDAARARLDLSLLPRTFRCLDAMKWPSLDLMQTTTASYPLMSMMTNLANTLVSNRVFGKVRDAYKLHLVYS